MAQIVVNIQLNKMVRILGKDENHRFLHLSLLPSLLRKEEIMTVVSLLLPSSFSFS
jgi:hypothetical protein